VNTTSAGTGRLRGWIAVGAAAVLVAAVGVGGHFLPAQQAEKAAAGQPLVGRTTSVCTTGTLNSGNGSDSTESQVYGVSAKTGSGKDGSLVGRELGTTDSGNPALSVTTQGEGKIVSAPKNAVELTADGIMASSSAGMVYGISDTGEDRGLSLGPCATPAVDQWFTGLGATDELRSQLVLTNPDDKQAEVDLDFYGPKGSLSVPGGSGLLIPAGRSRTLSLPDLLGKVSGSITIHVHASIGRISAMARDLRTEDSGNPSGVDWHPASTAASTSQIIPAVPGGPGTRQLSISNTSDRRAKVKIEILGPQGPFTPVGTSQVDVGAHSATTVDVAKGLAQQIGTVRVTSDQPVLTSIRSERPGSSKPNDIAVETSQPAINGTGIAPAAVVDGSETELAISNGGTGSTTVRVQLFNLDGVSLYDEKIPIVGGASIERRVTQAGPAYLVVAAPEGSQVYGGITLRQQTGDVYGLASAALITPALAGSARTSEINPHVAQ
jgi:hypothetical protein